MGPAVCAGRASDRNYTWLESTVRPHAAGQNVVAAQLNVLIGQIRGDLQATLNAANGNVGTMVASLDSLSAHVAGLHPHVDGASAAVRADRARMVKILAEARATAAKVHAARVSADKSATNVSGK